MLAVPLVQEIKRAFPHAPIDVIAERRNREVFLALQGTIDQCYCYDQQPFRIWRLLRQHPYDLVFDTEQWHHLNALLARTSAAPIRVGFSTTLLRNRSYTVLVPYSHEEFEGVSFLSMLSAILGREVTVDWTRAFLHPPQRDLRWAEAILSNRRIVALAVRGGIEERCWEPEKFQRLLRRLLDDGWDACVLGGGADAVMARQICHALPKERIIDLIGTASLWQSAAILSRSRLFIGTDSGLLHLASAVGTPVVALFGAGIEAKWAPRGSRSRILNHHLSCSPCTRFGYTPRCPIHVQCLREISVDEVARAAQELLRSGGGSPP